MMNWKPIFCLISVVLLIATETLSADKVVVVPLSSSSISKQQTYKYDRDALRISGISGSYIHYLNGCANNSVDGASSFVPLTFPVGAKIVSIFVNIYDGSSTDGYDIRLIRHYISGVNFYGPTVIYTTGGSSTSPQIAKKLLTPKTPETVDGNESFTLQFTTDSASANSFCSAQITLELP